MLNIAGQSIYAMQKKVLLLLILLFCLVNARAREIVLKGNYYGYNLYVLNPSIGNDDYCVTKVFINQKPVETDIRSNAFEIDFSLLGYKIGDAVEVIIKHSDNCTPQIINPKALLAGEAFSFSYFKADKNGKLFWGVNGELNEDPFIVEQFRWNKWVVIGEVSTTDTLQKGSYTFETYPHYGLNQYRIIRNDINGNPVFSKVIKINGKSEELTLESSKVSDKLVFSNETMYEIYDMKGNFLSSGISYQVDVSDLEKGKYWVNFDNKSVNFTKK